MKKYELLAPVGDYRTLRAAVAAGADAVYFGIKGFNMRAGAKNFGIKDLKKIRAICDKGKDCRMVRMYLTLNVICYEEELRKLEKLIRSVKGKIDAIICWDLGVVELCRKYGIEFHVSTQASVSNSAAAKFYKKLGAKRIVFARELNLKQIKKVSGIIDAECFCHGAMCVAVSGRCFMSQFSHGLSANRGQCAQSCRRGYKVTDENNNELILENNKVMSAKDLCTLPFIEKMKKAGVKSFKIEGRMRSPEYVYTVVSVYRRALDNKLNEKEIREEINELKKVYNRGFSSGFYIRAPTADDFSFSENGEQTEAKKFVGKVEKVWPKVDACSVRINTGKMKVEDEVILVCDRKVMRRGSVISIENEGKDVKTAKKGDFVGVKFSSGCKAVKGDEVYLVVVKR